MAQKNWKPSYSLKPIYVNNGLTIWQGPNVKDFDPAINRVDSVFYVETEGKVRYAKFDAIKMLEFVFVNMVYEGEREKVRKMLKETFKL